MDLGFLALEFQAKTIVLTLSSERRRAGILWVTIRNSDIKKYQGEEQKAVHDDILFGFDQIAVSWF